MNSVSGNPKGLSAHALLRAARSRTVFIALLLLPAMGGVASTLSAQGDPKAVAPDPYLTLTTYADGGLDRVCVGAPVAFRVIALHRRVTKSDGDDPKNLLERVNEVLVLSYVLDPSYGTLKPSSARTWALQTPSGSTVFTFTGLRPGRTELRFEGVGSSQSGPGNSGTYRPLKRGVTIVSCDSPIASTDAGAGSGVSKDRKSEVKPKTIPKVEVKAISKVRVTTTSTWSVGMDIVATIDEAVMDADDQGKFAGSADVTWQTSVIGTAACGAAEYRIAPSRADLTGEIDESNQLVVKITFQPRDFSGFATCGPATVSTGNLATPDPLTIRVAATGGTSTQPHAVTARNGAFVGSVTVVVTPESE